jgi:hypothetical protein
MKSEVISEIYVFQENTDNKRDCEMVGIAQEEAMN